MRRTSALHAPALRTALAAALLLAGGLAGTAVGTQPASAAPPAAHAAAPASTGLLEAMERDFGLTRGQAEERLRAEKAAVTVEKKARDLAGPSYAGSWFDAADGRLKVALTSRDKAAEVEAAGADVRVVRYSAERLDRVKERIDTLSAPPGVSSWYVDPQLNRVVIKVVDADREKKAVRAFVERASAAGPVSVARTAQAPAPYAAGTVGGDPYYTGNVRCSIGFSVHGGFVTAGHCGRAGAAVRGWDGSAMGTFQGSSFPGDDYAYVSIHSGWWTVPVVLGWGTIPDRLVRGSAEAPVGASICRSGSTTHWHCGNVLAKNETVNYSQGAVHQMTKTSVCAEGGDSGGSFISGDQAQGVTSGGWGNCSGGGETWFQPVNEILGRYGLTLHTA
ncbi:S1 family peptidase [Streptomyces sp. SP18CS02]|uniref:S1 family peptidase n=1 Tax=Streptomyces sp. SP18CS02 TaxID=3002531 RepID=UPI002E792C99|nr:S1 family peptidase [Streptomyces sp. SP18CS02]MEE1754651.1 S1 family peptidase [Streptomyces sp. SP18CS02]